MATLIKGGRVVSPRGITQTDILIENGAISALGHFPEYDGTVIDATGRLVFPGFIDPHTHFELEVGDGFTADDFASGTKAALAGGTTCIIDFVNHTKDDTLESCLTHWHQKAEGRCACDYGFHMSLSRWDADIARELDTMPARGITSFKAYMTYSWRMADEEILAAMQRLKGFGGLLGVHCEAGQMIDARLAGLEGPGPRLPTLHPLSRPPQVEAEAIRRLGKLTRRAGVRAMVVHLSTKEGLMAARDYPELLIETCPQYLLLDESLYSLPEHEAQKFICSPPLRSACDREALWQAVADGTVSTIATDHCSFTPAQKAAGDGDFTKVPNGLPGVQTRPQLIWSEGVVAGRITPERMCALLAENPAKIYGLFPKKGIIAPGSDGDLVIWNPNSKETLTAKSQLSAAGYCPFEGMKVTGAAETVLLRGKVAAENGNIICENLGQYTPRGIPEV